MDALTLKENAEKLKLYGIACHWDEITDKDLLKQIITWEQEERQARSLQRRLTQSHLQQFKLMHEFDWNWPKECDRFLIEDCLGLNFIEKVMNIIILGPNGVGKSMIASNIVHEAILKGHTALFVTASEMLNTLAAQDSDSALHRRIKDYVKPAVLFIDELGYLSYSNRHADLLFEVISRRYQQKSTIVTTNKAFSDWSEIFPNATCVVTLIDRLVHKSEIIKIDGDSYRLKEAEEYKQQREAERRDKAETKNPAC